MRILDISPTLSPRTAVWPGDVPLSRSVALDFKAGDNLVLSSVSSTVHIGAHADAPSHYHPDGEDISARRLEPYLGPCQVIAVDCAPGARIRVQDLPGPITAPRVLFRTGSFPDPNAWPTDFNSLSPALIEHLAASEVTLVGIDTPSVDPFDSKALESHNALFAADMSVLEGLVLEGVAPGHYELIALPLKLEGADASPVRAVLVSR